MTPPAGPAVLAVPTPADEPGPRLRAWLVAYADEPRSDKTALAVIREPRAAWAYAQSVDAAAALANEVAPPANSNGFVFMFVPSGSSTAYAIQKQAEQWMASRPGERDGIMEVLFRSERLLWRRGRALAFGTPQLIDDMLAAVVHFSLCESDLGQLERQAEEACATLDNDKQLCNHLRSSDLKRRPHVDAMTRMAVDMRLAYLRIDKALEAPSAEISGSARRLFIELATLATAKNRLLRLDDVIDAVLDQYRFINDRFSEYRYFVREYLLVVLILAALAIELMGALQQAWLPQLQHLIGLVRP